MNRRFLRFRVAVLLTLSVCAVVEAAEPSDFGCIGNTIEQGECLEKAFETADKELNATYQTLIRMVSSHGDGWDNNLRAAQRKWIEFRDLNCEFYGNYLKGGTGAGLYFGACKVRMTKERTTELGRKRDELARRGY